MQVHPALAALRSDDAPQRQAQSMLFAATAEWKDGERAIIAALEDHGAGAELAECAALATLFSDPTRAQDFAAGFVSRTAQALADAPLGHVPLRHFTDGTNSTLLLARSGRAALFLAAVNGAELALQPRPVSVRFAATESHEMILAGRAEAELIANDLTTTAVKLVSGTTIFRDGASEALILREVRGTLVSLRLQRRAAMSAPTREIDLTTGRLIHQAAGSADESRTELMIALLGRMGRRDAAPALSRIAGEPGPAGLRWQALRECLGLDTAVGFLALSNLAAARMDELAEPAQGLRDQLIEAHPQLAELAHCPA